MEYYDKTLFELTAELEGYNRRWEEKWRHTRRLYTLIYNKDIPKNKQKQEFQLMPFESERKMKTEKSLKDLEDFAKQFS